MAFTTISRLLELESKILLLNTLAMKPAEIQEIYNSFIKKTIDDKDYTLSKAFDVMIGVEQSVGLQILLHFKPLFEWDLEYERENRILAEITE